jgi:hypothetical protein
MNLHDLSRLMTLFENRRGVIDVLNSILQQINVPADLIGGVALGSYNYIRNTEDIDILIDKSDYDKVANAIIRAGGNSLGKNNKFSLSGHTIQICYSGLKVRHTTFKRPSNTEPGLKVIDLPQLLLMKIEAGISQFRHRADFIELVKRNDISLQYLEDHVFGSLDKMARAQAIELWKRAQEERTS